MRLSELEQTTGVPAATIKYYLREGLLHPGRAVSARLAEYDESHARRLRLLRVLRGVGDVPVSRLQLLAQAVEDERPVHALLDVTADVLAPPPPPEIGGRDRSRERAGELLARRVVGQVLFGHLLAILRRLAEEHHSGERFGRSGS